MFEATALLKIREGELEAFKQQAAEVMRLMRDQRATAPLRLVPERRRTAGSRRQRGTHPRSPPRTPARRASAAATASPGSTTPRAAYFLHHRPQQIRVRRLELLAKPARTSIVVSTTVFLLYEVSCRTSRG